MLSEVLTGLPAANDPACQWWDKVCDIGNGIKDIGNTVAGGAIDQVATATVQMVGKFVAAFASLWMLVPDPPIRLSSTNTEAVGQYGTEVPGGTADAFSTILSFGQWIGIAVAVVSFIAFGIGLIMRRRGHGDSVLSRLMPLAGGLLLVGSFAALASTLGSPQLDSNAATPVYFIQSQTAWFTAILVAISILSTAVTMMILHRGEPARDLAVGIAKMSFIAGAGTLVTSLLMQAFDSWTVGVLNTATNCKAGGEQASCFGDAMSKLLILANSSTLGQLGVIVAGVFMGILVFVQMVLMVARAAILPIVVGLLPVAYAAGLIPGGKQMAQKITGWTIAFILYKPVAGLIYAAGMVMVGAGLIPSTAGPLQNFYQMILGFIVLGIACFAIYALMRLIVPAVGAVASGVGPGAAAVALGMVAVDGALTAANGAIGGGKGGGGSGGGMPSFDGGGSGGGAQQSGATPGAGGPTGGPSAAGSGGGSSAGAGAGGAAAGGGGAAAAGAATGGVALGAGVAVEAAQRASDGVKSVANGAAQVSSSATGEA